MARLDMETLVQGGAMGRAVSADVYFEMGIKYSAGRGVDVDLIEAHKWFNLAAMGGKEAAIAYRSEIACELGKAGTARALRAAREWMKLH